MIQIQELRTSLNILLFIMKEIYVTYKNRLNK